MLDARRGITLRSARAAACALLGARRGPAPRYLGGGHAQKDWYLEKIAAFDIPIVYSSDELLEYLRDVEVE